MSTPINGALFYPGVAHDKYTDFCYAICHLLLHETGQKSVILLLRGKLMSDKEKYSDEVLLFSRCGYRKQ